MPLAVALHGGIRVGVQAPPKVSSLFFFFNDTATTEIYTLSLHDALPILRGGGRDDVREYVAPLVDVLLSLRGEDRKSTRLNSSHVRTSYAVFCLNTEPKVARTFLTLLHCHHRSARGEQDTSVLAPT